MHQIQMKDYNNNHVQCKEENHMNRPPNKHKFYHNFQKQETTRQMVSQKASKNLPKLGAINEEEKSSSDSCR